MIRANLSQDHVQRESVINVASESFCALNSFASALNGKNVGPQFLTQYLISTEPLRPKTRWLSSLGNARFGARCFLSCSLCIIRHALLNSRAGLDTAGQDERTKLEESSPVPGAGNRNSALSLDFERTYLQLEFDRFGSRGRFDSPTTCDGFENI